MPRRRGERRSTGESIRICCGSLARSEALSLDVVRHAGHDDPVIGTAGVPYIGRAPHRATVAAAFAEPGHVVLVCGEAGVGKSSLVAAERAAAVTEVIEGSCLQ